jgi:hypothetical protein
MWPSLIAHQGGAVLAVWHEGRLNAAETVSAFLGVRCGPEVLLRDGVKCRAFCSELHGTFVLAELAARDLGCLGGGEDLVTDMVSRHLAGEVLDGSSQEEIDSDVDRTLGSGSEPAA